MVDLEIIKEWILKGDDDFEFAKINLEEKKPFYSQICFHFQQAAEKYLKAYIIQNNLEFRKTHDLPLLLKQCASKHSAFNDYAEECEYLNTYYIEARYPVHWPIHLTLKETAKACLAAESLIRFIRKNLTLK